MNSTQESDKKEDNKLSKQIWAEAKKNYRLLKIIGEGTFGIVVKAQSKHTGEKVAIKLITNISSSSF
jgi:serine/threonine protein kinase